MTGRVVDAATGRPIRGAWVAWRPPPPHLIAQILPTAQQGDPGISDAQGRFVLERLPDDLQVADTLYAVAPGYGYAARRAGLSEVVLALPGSTSLEIVLDPPPEGNEDPPVQIAIDPLSKDPLAHATTAALPPWGQERDRYRLQHLPPGRYRVRVDPQVAGSRVHEVHLVAGASAQLRVSRAPRAELAGTVIGPRGVSATELAWIDLETFTRYEVAADERGFFRIVLPKARYALMLLDGRSERSVPGEFSPGRELSLDLPSAGDPVELRIREQGRPVVAGDLGLVRLDRRFGDLVALEARAGDPGTYAALAPPGRYALFAGVSLLLELTLPQPTGAPAIEIQRGLVELELVLPTQLRPGEIVRGTLALVPASLKKKRPDLYLRFAAAGQPFQVSPGSTRVRCPLSQAGLYLLSGKTDLGPLEGALELAPGQRIKLSLGGE
ncbi:MAG: carboxypeptidase regulatory-like domain-containing protein [Planctomycetes bacterium]|nr:carboxypeptidase regulatory-like domain-containing protein [Planctomycetota bacterium]